MTISGGAVLTCSDTKACTSYSSQTIGRRRRHFYAVVAQVMMTASGAELFHGSVDVTATLSGQAAAPLAGNQQLLNDERLF